VATAFGEADKKFTKSVPPIRWRILHKLLRNLNSGLDKVTSGEIVIVMTRTGAATWNEAMTIDHPQFVTMAYLNFAEVSTSADEHDKITKQLNAMGNGGGQRFQRIRVRHPDVGAHLGAAGEDG
jgi:hypothetical protein